MKKHVLALLLGITSLCVAPLVFGETQPGLTECQEVINNNCNKCHSSARICNELGKADVNWPKIVKKMGDKAVLSKEIQDAVVDCLSKSADPAALVCKKK